MLGDALYVVARCRHWNFRVHVCALDHTPINSDCRYAPIVTCTRFPTILTSATLGCDEMIKFDEDSFLNRFDALFIFLVTM